MYLTYNKSLAMFDQCMVQLELDKPNDSKVYVEFQEGFIPLAAKYYEAFYAPTPVVAPGVVEVLVDKPTVASGVKEVIVDKPTVVVVEDVPLVDYVDPAPVSIHAPAEPVVVVEDIPVVDVVRLDPIPDPAPVVAPAQSLAKKARKTSV
jgi:hypothetical protein